MIFAQSDQLFSCPALTLQMDRFIPARSAMDLDVANFNLLKENNSQGNTVEVTASPKVYALLQGPHWSLQQLSLDVHCVLPAGGIQEAVG